MHLLKLMILITCFLCLQGGQKAYANNSELPKEYIEAQIHYLLDVFKKTKKQVIHNNILIGHFDEFIILNPELSTTHSTIGKFTRAFTAAEVLQPELLTHPDGANSAKIKQSLDQYIMQANELRMRLWGPEFELDNETWVQILGLATWLNQKIEERIDDNITPSDPLLNIYLQTLNTIAPNKQDFQNFSRHKRYAQRARFAESFLSIFLASTGAMIGITSNEWVATTPFFAIALILNKGLPINNLSAQRVKVAETIYALRIQAEYKCSAYLANSNLNQYP